MMEITMKKILVTLFLLISPISQACDQIPLSLGAGYDAGKTFPQAMSDFRIECVWDNGIYLGYGHHSTYNTGWPFNDQKDKNTSDYVYAGYRIDLKRLFK